MFRFTIRELLLLTVIVGLVLGWVLRERQVRNQLAEGRHWETSAKEFARFAEGEAGWEVLWEYGAVYVEHPADGGRGAYRIFDLAAYQRAKSSQ